MRSHLSLEKDSEANAAASAAARGAVFGASKWGIATAALGAVAYAAWPVYRGVTVQFKVFLQMAGMTLGGMIEADRRLREHEGVVRRRKRVERDQQVWRKWEGLVEDEPRALESAALGDESRAVGDVEESAGGRVADVVGKAGTGER